MFTSTAAVCRMTNIFPATLSCWQAASLITPPCRKGYSESQLAQIRVIRALTSSGDALSEIHTLLTDSWHYRHSGWDFRRQEFILTLASGTDEACNRYVWQLYTSYSPEDIVTYLLTPLAVWLRREDKEMLRSRCIACLLKLTQRLLENRHSAEYVKPLLHIIRLIKRYPMPVATRRPSLYRDVVRCSSRLRNIPSASREASADNTPGHLL